LINKLTLVLYYALIPPYVGGTGAIRFKLIIRFGLFGVAKFRQDEIRNWSMPCKIKNRWFRYRYFCSVFVFTEVQPNLLPIPNRLHQVATKSKARKWMMKWRENLIVSCGCWRSMLGASPSSPLQAHWAPPLCWAHCRAPSVTVDSLNPAARSPNLSALPTEALRSMYPPLPLPSAQAWRWKGKAARKRESWLPACVLVNLHILTGCDFGLRSLNGLKQRRGWWRRGKGLFGFDGVSVGSEMKTNTDAKHQNC
jgi:hypothetical protein